MEEALRRKRPAHWLPQPEHPSPIVFLTCCTQDRRRCLDNQAAHLSVRDAWMSAQRWLIGRYVLMPDHLHLFCTPGADACPLDEWIAYWRRQISRALGHPKGALWQREFWDRQLRREDSYAESWEYVRNNPVRAGLVERAEDWPYQGELNALEWMGRR